MLHMGRIAGAHTSAADALLLLLRRCDVRRGNVDGDVLLNGVSVGDVWLRRVRVLDATCRVLVQAGKCFNAACLVADALRESLAAVAADADADADVGLRDVLHNCVASLSSSLGRCYLHVRRYAVLFVCTPSHRCMRCSRAAGRRCGCAAGV
jgi:hypothetical protein